MLPGEIIFDILIRVPAKSIGRFRCVSKPWQRLLSQPHFIKAHICRNRQHPRQESLLLLISAEFYSCSLTNAHQLFDKITASATNLAVAHVHLDYCTDHGIASCDGLVLIRNFGHQMYLFNPTTREARELPDSPYALDYFASFIMYGIGYDQVSDDYKVVSLSYYDTDNEHEPDSTEMFVNVFSVKIGSWKRAQSSPYDHAVGHVTSGVYAHGRVHWLASTGFDCRNVIAGFDLVDEEFHEVPAPRSLDGLTFVFDQLVVLGGCLCMFRTSRDCAIDVWVMREYGVVDSWTKLPLIEPEGAEFRPLCMLGQREVVGVKDEDTPDEALMTYNLDSGTCRVIEVRGIAEIFQVGGAFMESLVSPYYSIGTQVE